MGGREILRLGLKRSDLSNRASLRRVGARLETLCFLRYPRNVIGEDIIACTRLVTPVIVEKEEKKKRKMRLDEPRESGYWDKRFDRKID